MFKRLTLALATAIVTLSADGAIAAETSAGFLPGTWTLKAAYEIAPDGSMVYPYGKAPEGILFVDAEGRYSVEIYGENRAKFSVATAMPDDYKAALTTMSVHMGTVEVDPKAGVLLFHMQRNGMSERDGTTQRRPYQLQGDTLSYKIPASAEAKANTPVTVWVRAKSVQ